MHVNMHLIIKSNLDDAESALLEKVAALYLESLPSNISQTCVAFRRETFVARELWPISVVKQELAE